MRAFSLPDGTLLVEANAEDATLLGSRPNGPDGSPLQVAHAYHTLNAAGDCVRSYERSESSLQEHLSVVVYQVFGDELWDFFIDHNTDTDSPPTMIASVIVDGLIPRAVDEALERRVRSALTHTAAAQQLAIERDQREHAERLHRFERGLAAVRTKGSLVFVWRYDAEGAVTVSCGEKIIFRDASYAYSGKYLWRELEAILKKRFGRRLARFDVDVPDEQYLRFNPD